MLDWHKLVNLINKNNPELMNEVYLRTTGSTKNKNIKIVVRCKSGGGGHSNAPSKHDCSIKVGDAQTEVWIPNKPFDEVKPKGNLQTISDLKRSLSSTAFKIVSNFIYDNQAAIIALWYAPDGENGRVGSTILSYIRNKLATVDYSSVKVKPKTAAELDADKEAITQYVKDTLQDDTIDLSFGS